MEYTALGKLISKAKVEKCGDRSFPVLSMTMHDGIVFQNDRFKKDIASVDRSNYSVVKYNQLVVSFPIDEGVLAVQDITEYGIVSPAYKIWDINQNLIIPKYLEMWLRSPKSIDYYKSKLRGTTARRRSIPEEDFLAMPVAIPTKEIQEFAIDLIRRTKKIIELKEKEIAALDELVKARFVEMFGDNMENPHGYEQDKLGNIYKFQYGKGNNIPENKGEYPCYGSNGIVGHHIEFNSEDSPIIGHIGAYAGIVNWGAGKHYVTYNGVICKLQTVKVNPIYGFVLLQQQDFNRVATKGGGQPFVSYADLEAPTVVIPPIELQNIYAEFYKRIEKTKSTIEKALEQSQLLFDSLMQRYFGE